MDGVGFVRIPLGEEVERASLVQWMILDCWKLLGVVDLGDIGYCSCSNYARSKFHGLSVGPGRTFR